MPSPHNRKKIESCSFPQSRPQGQRLEQSWPETFLERRRSAQAAGWPKVKQPQLKSPSSPVPKPFKVRAVHIPIAHVLTIIYQTQKDSKIQQGQEAQDPRCAAQGDRFCTTDSLSKREESLKSKTQQWKEPMHLLVKA